MADTGVRGRKQKAAAKEPGTCCPIMELALSRQPTNNLGLYTGTRFTLKTGAFSPAVVIGFRKAKKDEPQEHKNATFAWVNWCPFCGAKQS